MDRPPQPTRLGTDVVTLNRDLTTYIAARELSNTRLEGDCVVTTRSLNRYGYREAYYAGKYVGVAHRIVYEALVGPIPTGLVLDHLCRTRACLNVLHLEAVTQDENNRRAVLVRSLRVRSRPTCVNGHPRNLATVYLHRGTVYCRVCNADAQRRRKAVRSL